MNIVLYTNSFLPAVGGKEVVVHYLAREFRRMGHRVRVMGPSGWIKNHRYRFGYPVHRWPTLRGFLDETVARWQLRLDVMLFGADVIHAHNTYPCGYTASTIRRRKRVPMVVTPHGYDIHVIPEMGFGMRLDPEKARKIKLVLSDADFLTAISGSIRRSLIDAGASEAKIIDIPNGIDLERFRPKGDLQIKKRLGLSERCRIILSVGNYHPRKGQELLVRSLPAILRRHPEAMLVIVGRNSNPLVKTIKDLDLTAKVRLTGSIPFRISDRKSHENGSGNSDVLAELYRACEVYVSASLDEGAEGLSLAMLDAMGSGKPVIATDISGNRDLIHDHQNGLLVPPGDPAVIAKAVTEVLDHQMLQEKLGNNARMVAERYSWQSVAKQYMAVYQCAANRYRRKDVNDALR